MPRSPSDPQKLLRSALYGANLRSAQRRLKEGATLEGSEEERAQLALSAMGPFNTHPDQIVENWQWLADRGFRFPVQRESHVKIMRNLLVSTNRPITLVDQWSKHAGHPPLYFPDRQDLFDVALFRQDTMALQWWHDQGWPLPEVPAQSPHYPNILETLSQLKLNAGAHVTWLLDHGVHPSSHAIAYDTGGAKPEETPLIMIGRFHRSLPDQTSDQVNGFRTMWMALVSAGDDPHFRNSAGECPLDLLKETVSANWWEARQRQGLLLQQPGPTSPLRVRRRLRT